MKASQIVTGETYLFVATDQATRKHLEGTEFTVFEVRKVWRKMKKRRAYVYRYFNEYGEGARAEELEELPGDGERLERVENFTGPKDSSEFEKNDDKLPF